MATVGMMSSNDVPGKSVDLPPSPSNSIPFITATAADEDKPEKVVAPINGGSPMRYLQASSKLDLEPNPFEQSFSGMSGKTGSDAVKVETPKPVLPSIASMSGRLAPSNDQFGWDAQSLRMGPLSPSMLEGPQNPIVFDKPLSQNPVPIGSFPSSSASLSTVFASASSLSQPGIPFVGLPGPLPVPPPAAAVAQAADSYQALVPPAPFNHNQQLVQQSGAGSQQPQQINHSLAQQPLNNRFVSPQGHAHPDNEHGNLHLLSAAVRESWPKRESIDQNGSAPHGQPHYQTQPHQHPHPHSHQSQHIAQHAQHAQHSQHLQHPHHHQQYQHHPHQSTPQSGVMPAPQRAKPGVEPTSATRGVRRPRHVSEDNSDDSELSRHSGNGGENNPNKKKNTGPVDDKMDEEEKRKNFLERNRQAALKCRQRKKQWLSNLQTKVEYLSTDNEHLQNQTAMLRDEIIHLKALLLAHKDCPVAQANGVYGDAIGAPNHGGMPHGRHPMQQQQPPQGIRGPAPPRGQHPPPPSQQHHHHSIQGSNGPTNGHGSNGSIGVNAGPRVNGHPSQGPAAALGSLVT
ncbi:hypothetical protein BG004_003091, partial [Podila humilis]